MVPTKISEDDWELIIERIYGPECECVPFLGAAVNKAVRGYKGLPLGHEVNRRLLEKLLRKPVPDLQKLIRIKPDNSLKNYQDLWRLGIEDLARVALHFKLKKDAPSLINHLREFLPDANLGPSKILKVLADRPFKLFVTTNYDRLMEKALQGAGKSCLPVVQPVKGYNADAQHRLGDELGEQLEKKNGVVLYKMHGTFLDEELGVPKKAKDVIITEEEYIQFLTVIGHPVKGVPAIIKAELQRSSLLFLGYSLQDWDFRAVFKGLIETLDENERRKSFAIQRKPSPFWVDFWKDKDVIIYDVDLYKFADELEKRCLAYEKKHRLNKK